MMSASGGAALLGILLAIASWIQLPVLHDIWLHAVVFMLLIVMHSGVRLGRKVYLVDMATMENRAMYVAVSNTVIGVAMLALGGIGMLTGFMGVDGVIFLLALLGLVAMIAAAGLDAP